MAAAFEFSARVATDDHALIGATVMGIAVVAIAVAVDDGIVQQGAFAFGDRGHLSHQVREISQLDVRTRDDRIHL